MNLQIQAAKYVATRAVRRASLYAVKYAPQVLAGTGVVTGVAALGFTVKSTLELEENTRRGRELVEGHKKLREERSVEEYPKAVYMRDMVRSYSLVVKGVIKTYALPAALAIASGASFLGAIGILAQRAAIMTAIAQTTQATFEAYKQRVEELVGEEKAREIEYGMKPAESTLEEVNTKPKKAKYLELDDPNKPSIYAAWFSSKQHNLWTPSAEATLNNLHLVEKYMNDKLNMRGHLYLNEVYDMLGLPRTKVGQVVGWSLKNPRGDGYVSLRLEQVEAQMNSPFVLFPDDGFWINPNVDGNILDMV